MTAIPATHVTILLRGLVSRTRAFERLASMLDAVERPAMPGRRSAAYSDAIPWHQWPERGVYSLYLASWASIPVMETRGDWSGDIRDIEALSASKSSLHYDTLDDFAVANCQPFVQDISEDALRANLRHPGIGLLHSPPWDALVRFAWDGRIFLGNGDGSHHFATARFIAGALQRQVLISATLSEHALDASAIAELLQTRALFAIPDDAPDTLYQALHLCGVTFEVGDVPGTSLRSMGTGGASPIQVKRPGTTRLLELATDDTAGAHAAATFRRLGFCDVGRELLRIATQQQLLFPPSAEARSFREHTRFDNLADAEGHDG